jgi:beta-glucosidase
VLINGASHLILLLLTLSVMLWASGTCLERYSILNVEQRVEDLLGRMTLAEKAGMLFQTMIVVGSGDLSEPDSAFGVNSAEHMIKGQQLTHFNVVRAADDARTLAEWQNRLQKLAATTRLGIPVTLSTDPRHHFTENVGTAAAAGAFSQWPETLGLAAIGSAELVQRFADIARHGVPGGRSAARPASSS